MTPNRNTPYLSIAILLFILLPWAGNLHGAGIGKEPPEAADKTSGNSAPCTETVSRTVHAFVLDGTKQQYTATAGIRSVAPDAEAPQGCIFFVAYTLQDASKADRPLTFAFNGGPGAASVWLHMGGLGPKRVVIGEAGEVPPAPARYESNPSTWLAFTDLVFVDPVGTGFSRSAPDTAEVRNKFYGVRQDIETMAEFIRRYISENQRWLSPLYLAGESYGTTRVAALTGHLQQTYGIDLAAVVLISPVLDFHTILFHPSNDLPYLLYLPTYAASAKHHHKGEASFNDLESLLKAAEDFCLDTYAAMLVRGDGMTKEEKLSLARNLADFTGLSVEDIRRWNYRVGWIDFSRSLLKDRNRIIGRMDATITGKPGARDGRYPYDPSLDPLFGLFSSTMNHYVRTDLAFETKRIYHFLNPQVNRNWDWRSGLSGDQGFIDVSHTLARTMSVNPHLKVFIASGIYDLATPYFAAQYTVRHMWLGELRKNVVLKRYHSGHMIYTHQQAHENLYRDVRNFYSTARAPRTATKNEEGYNSQPLVKEVSGFRFQVLCFSFLKPEH